MKTLFFLLFSVGLSAQNITYKLEYLKADSMFLTETIFQPVEGSPRPQEVVTSLFFRDTLALNTFIETMQKDANNAELELKQVQNKVLVHRKRMQAILPIKAQKKVVPKKKKQ